MRIGKVDYICSADATADDLSADTAVESLIAVSEILKELSANSGALDLVITDGAGWHESDVVAKRAANFGATPPTPSANQAVVLSRSAARCAPEGDAAPRTWFLQSVLDGLSQLGDEDRADGVTVLEFQKYLGDHADVVRTEGKVNGHQNPQSAVSSGSDFTLVTADDLQPAQVTPEFKAAMSQHMIQLAERALLIERDAAASRDALARLAPLNPAGALRSRADSLLWMTMALRGRLQDAWDLASAGERPLFVVVPRDMALYGETAQLKAGTVLQIARVADNDGVTWAKVSARFQQDYDSGVVRLSKIDAPEAWTQGTFLTAGQEAQTASASQDALTDVLKKIYPPSK